jgi:lambda repressor-like predicted transcriptional regulator
MADDIPQPWRSALESRGLASYRRLGDRAGISHETARRLILGMRTSRSTVRAVADAMGVDVEEIHRLRGEPAPDTSSEWTPPPSASPTCTYAIAKTEAAPE